SEPRGPSGLGLVARSASLVACLLLVQLLLHPVFLGAPLRTWALYWLYTYPGVILPGTLLVLATVDRRADWLTWLGLGWVVGHALELLALLLARQSGHPGLFGLWIPLAYGIALARRGVWERRLAPLAHPLQVAAGSTLLLMVGASTYFVLNLAELTAFPPYVSDVWFHVNNAHEFRDHAPMQDPRLAGEPFNYHVHGYAIVAAASLATGEAVLPLLVRYSGMSCVLLLALGLFNVGRAFGGGSVTAGVMAALLVIFPIDVFELFLSPAFSFGGTLPLHGVYLSTTTLAGYLYLSGLLILVYWIRQGLAARACWPLPVLAFAGAGAKAMFGPVVLAGALGLAGWTLLVRRSFDRRAWATAVLLCAGILPALLPLVLGEGSYVQSTVWAYASFARTAPYFERLAPHAPEWLVSSLWIFGFGFLTWAGGVAAAGFKRGCAGDASFGVFAWMCFLASLVPALSMELDGSAELFFLYYGACALAAIAGFGLYELARRTWASRRRRWLVLGLPPAYVGLHLALNLPFSVVIDDPAATREIWRRAVWLRLAGLAPGEESLRRPPGSRGGVFGMLVLSEDARRGLEWARQNLPEDAVFVVNVYEASPYAAYSESRAFLETTLYHVLSHLPDRRPSERRFRMRRRIVRGWREGDAGTLERMQAAGITHLFVDRYNGDPVEALGEPVFESPGFAIYELPRPE
ncbi:MAG TPA: hypothetical protein VLL48_14530, partial [Longimicrobiales bacterium]|nr:hypothetical protein [Longimicrobiales bacterium]